MADNGWETVKRAVIRRAGRECLTDVNNHGADSGFSGFCYYNETTAFTKRHKKAIITRLKELAEDLGEESAAQMMTGWKCLKGIPRDDIAAYLANGHIEDDTATQLANALAWFALEETAREEVEGN